MSELKQAAFPTGNPLGYVTTTELVERNFCIALCSALKPEEISKVLHVYLNLRDGHTDTSEMIDRPLTQSDAKLLGMAGEIYNRTGKEKGNE